MEGILEKIIIVYLIYLVLSLILTTFCGIKHGWHTTRPKWASNVTYPCVILFPFIMLIMIIWGILIVN